MEAIENMYLVNSPPRRYYGHFMNNTDPNIQPTTPKMTTNANALTRRALLVAAIVTTAASIWLGGSLVLAHPEIIISLAAMLGIAGFAILDFQGRGHVLRNPRFERRLREATGASAIKLVAFPQADDRMAA